MIGRDGVGRGRVIAIHSDNCFTFAGLPSIENSII
jgi:hypothetical protein